MRKHIFVTGQPGVGKSTLIQRVLEQLQLPPHSATGGGMLSRQQVSAPLFGCHTAFPTQLLPLFRLAYVLLFLTSTVKHAQLQPHLVTLSQASIQRKWSVVGNAQGLMS